MINRFVLIVVLAPLAIVMIALAVANRGPVAFTLDPFNPGNPALTLQMPLFFLMFAALAAGLLIGSMVTWLKQGRYRRMARHRDLEVKAAHARETRPAAAGVALPKPSA